MQTKHNIYTGLLSLNRVVDGILNARHYIDEILQPMVVPYIQTMEPSALLQDDNWPSLA